MYDRSFQTIVKRDTSFKQRHTVTDGRRIIQDLKKTIVFFRREGNLQVAGETQK